MASSTRFTTSSTLSTLGSQWSMQPSPSRTFSGNCASESNPPATGVALFHGNGSHPSLFQGRHDEPVGTLAAVPAVEVGVAEMHSGGQALEAVQHLVDQVHARSIS